MRTLVTASRILIAAAPAAAQDYTPVAVDFRFGWTFPTTDLKQSFYVWGPEITSAAQLPAATATTNCSGGAPGATLMRLVGCAPGPLPGAGNVDADRRRFSIRRSTHTRPPPPGPVAPGKPPSVGARQ